MQKNPLHKFGNVPIQNNAIEACFGQQSVPSKKVQSLEKAGEIIRLKRGLYVVSHEVSGKEIDARLCANHIYGPSYVSLQWALRWYGLIPEQVHAMTSVTTKRSRSFENQLGTFVYYQVSPKYFPIGVTSVCDNAACCLMATPEKALCDVILRDSFLPPQSVSGLVQYLEEDIRFDMDAFRQFDKNIISACACCGRKETILNNLVKIITR